MESPTPVPTPTPTPTPTLGSSDPGKKIVLIALGVLLALVLLASFGSWVTAKLVGFGLKKAAETAGYIDGSAIKIGEDGTIVFTAESGERAAITGGKEMPPDFPSDFPVASGLSVESAATADTPDGKLFTVVWEARGDASAALAFYERELPARGWTIDQRIGSGDGTTLFFSRPAGDDEEDGGWIGFGTDERTSVILFLVVKK